MRAPALKLVIALKVNADKVAVVADEFKSAQLHLSLSTNDDDDDKDGSTNSGIISVFKIITRALQCYHDTKNNSSTTNT